MQQILSVTLIILSLVPEGFFLHFYGQSDDLAKLEIVHIGSKMCQNVKRVSCIFCRTN